MLTTLNCHYHLLIHSHQSCWIIVKCCRWALTENNWLKWQICKGINKQITVFICISCLSNRHMYGRNNLPLMTIMMIEMMILSSDSIILRLIWLSKWTFDKKILFCCYWSQYFLFNFIRRKNSICASLCFDHFKLLEEKVCTFFHNSRFLKVILQSDWCLHLW